MNYMKLITRFSSILLAITCTTSISFAASSNHVTKVVTVAKNSPLDNQFPKGVIPELVLSLKDGLQAGDVFYLHLNHAEWLSSQLTIAEYDLDNHLVSTTENLKLNLITPTQLEIRVLNTSIPKGHTLRLPLHTKLSEENASLSIDSNNTLLTTEDLSFAKVSTQQGTATALATPKAVKKGTAAPILLEEAYGGQFLSDAANGASNKLTLTLENNQTAWDLQANDPITKKLTFLKAFEQLPSENLSYKLLSDQVVEITLPIKALPTNTLQKGGFKIEGLAIKRLNQATSELPITVKVEGDLLHPTVITPLILTDYKASLHPKAAYKSFSGRIQEVTFDLTESVADTIVRERPIDFTFTQDTTLVTNKDGKVPVTINGTKKFLEPIQSKNKIIGFTIPSLLLEETKGKLTQTFTLPLCIASTADGVIALKVEGRGLPQNIEAPMVQVTPPVQVETIPFTAKSGYKDQIGGEILLKETTSGSILQGETLFFQLETSDIALVKAPIVAVTTGDIQLSEPKLVEGGVALEVLKKSSTPSTILLKHFNFTVNRSVADGEYAIGVGGSALDSYGNVSSFHPIISNTFLNVNIDPSNPKQLSFRPNEEAYLLNEKYQHLEAPAIMRDTTLMLPIQSVATALDIPKNKIKWNEKTSTLTIYDKNIVEIKIGDATLKINGQVTPMSAPASLSNDYVMIPLESLATALDLDATWDAVNKTAILKNF